MKQVVEYLVIFALLGAPIYAIAASGLVVTYTTTGIFNFAHGAIGMIVAFTYWQITDSEATWGAPQWLPLDQIPLDWLPDFVTPPWPVPVGLAISLFVIAPAIGYTLDLVLFRRLAGSSTVTTIVATIGLLFALVSLANIIWPSGTGTREVDELFAGRTVTVLDVNISYHEIIALVAAIAVAVGLRALLFGTRLGTAMRAVVDNRELSALNGVEPNRVSSFAWMLGCSLAGLAGILVAPDLTLTSIALTLVVIQAYAVAMVGRLRSLPLTFLGALILSEIQKLIAYVDVKGWVGSFDDALTDLGSAAPILMLLAVLIVIGEDRAALRPEKFKFRVPRPSLTTVAIIMACLVAAAALVAATELVSADTVDVLGRGLAFGVIMLSLVLLTGWAGQVSLAQLALGGITALAVWKWGPLWGMAGGIVITAVVGGLVALPALRMRSLYLALTTMAFALLLETVVYGNNAIVSSFVPFATGSASADRPSLVESDKAFFVFMAVCFGLVALGLTVIRNGHFGRRLAAMKDSPGACATLGLDLTATKLQVFALSAAIAGFGGGLLAMWKSESVGRTDYALLEGGAEAGLPLLLVAVIGGITSVAGAMFGAVFFVVMPLLGRWYPSLTNITNLFPGLAGIGLSEHPDGAVSQVVAAIEERRAAKEAAEADPLSRPEQLGAGGRITGDEADRLDDELGLSWGT